MARRIRTLLVFLTLITAVSATLVPAWAEAPGDLKWENLIPKETDPLKDPLSSLTQDQRFDFETVVWARGLNEQQRALPENAQALADAEKYEIAFKKAGIDVTQLMAAYADWEAKLRERQKAVVQDLDGKQVRIPGYLLPLEFSEQGEKDFLLVPYVGACIHVPPPPPNQIVLVRLKEPFKPTELFTPVWASGLMRTKASSKSLTLVDGSANIAIGYHIDGGSVEVYQEK